MKRVLKQLKAYVNRLVSLLVLGLVGHTSALTAQSSGTFTLTGSMTTPRWAHTATLLLDGKVLIAGGYASRSQQYLASAELYDPTTGTFAPTGNMISARYFHTATLLHDGKVLITGGRGYNSPDGLVSAELYEPTTGTFTVTGKMVVPRMFHTATLLPQGQVLIASGSHGFAGSELAKAELYDPSTGTFTLTGDMASAWFGPAASLLPNGKVLLTGGIAGSERTPFTSAELYDPVSGTFSPTGNLAAPSYWHTSTTLASGKVLVVGGAFGDGGLISHQRAELYDPSSGTFTSSGSMASARSGHTATLLPGDWVLITGGDTTVCSGNSCYSRPSPGSAELYDPIADRFSPAGRMTVGRSGHTATLLNTGKVLIAGGDGPDAELYHPPTGTFSDARHPTVGTSLMVPSAVYSDEFVSSLVILNIDTKPNDVTISASNLLGESIGSLTVTLKVGERFRSTNILQRLGAPPGTSGPILVASSNNGLLSAVSEVFSSRGGAGFLPAVNLEAAWTQGVILEGADTGPRGMPGTYRTNLGLINPSRLSATNVTMALFNSYGQPVAPPLTIPLGIGCYTGCPNQINTIVQRLRGSVPVTEGHLMIASPQPIIAWASKVENGTDDPSFQIGIGSTSAHSQVSHDVGTRLLVPSSAYSEAFTSSLVVLNMDRQPNTLAISAYDPSGHPLAPPFTTTLPVGGQFHSTNILQLLGAPFDSFGPIRVESTNNRLLSAVSEVKNGQGFAGFFPAVNVDTGWTQGFILEAVDSGPRGTPATWRTNLGLNAISSGLTNVTITLFNDSGQQVGDSISKAVPADGLTQLDSIVQQLRGSASVTGGYLKIVSNQPIIAWVSKVENGSDDPSFQIGIGTASPVSALQ